LALAAGSLTPSEAKTKTPRSTNAAAHRARKGKKIKRPKKARKAHKAARHSSQR
jgi:hypothetical protein